MSEGGNLFPQLGCPISTPDLSSFILPLHYHFILPVEISEGINIFQKTPPVLLLPVQTSEGTKIFFRKRPVLGVHFDTLCPNE